MRAHQLAEERRADQVRVEAADRLAGLELKEQQLLEQEVKQEVEEYYGDLYREAESKKARAQWRLKRLKLAASRQALWRSEKLSWQEAMTKGQESRGELQMENRLGEIQDDTSRSQIDTSRSQDDAGRSQDDTSRSQDDAGRPQDDTSRSQDDAGRPQDDTSRSQDDAGRSQGHALQTTAASEVSLDAALKPEEQDVAAEVARGNVQLASGLLAQVSVIYDPLPTEGLMAAGSGSESGDITSVKPLLTGIV